MYWHVCIYDCDIVLMKKKEEREKKTHIKAKNDTCIVCIAAGVHATWPLCNWNTPDHEGITNSNHANVKDIKNFMPI